MRFRLRLVALACFFFLPCVPALAAEEPMEQPAEAASSESAPALEAPAPDCPLPGSEADQFLLGLPEAQPAGCQITCTFFCPDFPDQPPGECVGGCCVYPTCGSHECDFSFECARFHDCIGGCCVPS